MNRDALDPGIRDLVVSLRANGFNTTDSGDGVSKADLIASGDALDCPHVHIQVKPHAMLVEADRLLIAIRDWSKHDVRFEGADIQATYSPVDGIATISVFGVPSSAFD